MAVERYYNNDGQLAVLVSHGYGAGWSTWNDEYGIDLAIDKRVVKVFFEYKTFGKKIKHDELRDWLESIGYHNVYTGGWEDIRIEWVDKGTMFRISEYDGAESLETPQSKDWCTA